jgi:hypothetical protein
MAEQEPRDTRSKSTKTGRKKEQGGHTRINLSVEKFVSDALGKVGNRSQFAEKVMKPVLEKLDPAEASVFVWRIDAYIIQGISKAAQQEDFKQVQALAYLASCMEDARKLCGVPPSDFKFPLPSNEGALNFIDTKIYEWLQETKEIRNFDESVSSKQAMTAIRNLIAEMSGFLPEETTQDLKQCFDEKWKIFTSRWNKEVIGFRDPLTGSPEVSYLISLISQTLGRFRDKTKKQTTV